MLVAVLVVVTAAALADAPSPDGGEALRTQEFAPLTSQDALSWQGDPARYRVELDSLPDEAGGYVPHDCVSPAGESRTVYLLPGQDAAERMTVEGVLQVREVPPAARPGGTSFPGFAGLRVTDARRCR
jgi:hypothetical protein